MKRTFAMLAILGLLVVPVLASADETQIPPEANWTAIPPTPPLVAVEQSRTVSTPQEPTDVRSPAVTAPMSASVDDETAIPREANWAPTPGTPPVVVVPEQRTVVTPQAQDSVRQVPARTRAPSSFSAFRDGALGRLDGDNEAE